ncbi:unnamed protein product, partial [Tilletia caries]
MPHRTALSLDKAAAKVAPKAHHLVISNPVNSTVPIVAEVFKSLRPQASVLCHGSPPL